MSDSSTLPITRRRRTMHGWIINRPLMVDEPRWIVVEETKSPDDYKHEINHEDPFFVARGKRSLTNNLEKVNNLNEIIKQKATLWNYLDRDDGDNVKRTSDNKEFLDTILQEPFFASRGKKKKIVNNAQTIADVMDFFETGSLRDRRGKLVEQLLKESDPFYVARGKRNNHGNRTE